MSLWNYLNAGKGETDFNNFVKKHGSGNHECKCISVLPGMSRSFQSKVLILYIPDILVLPVSLQDESSTTNIASILETLPEILKIPLLIDKSYLSFDPVKLQFDIEDTRRRFIFLKSMDTHKKEHENIVSEHKQCNRGVVTLQVEDGTNLDAESDEDEDEIVPTIHPSDIYKI